jgi:hypothetical protein
LGIGKTGGKRASGDGSEQQGKTFFHGLLLINER